MHHAHDGGNKLLMKSANIIDQTLWHVLQSMTPDQRRNFEVHASAMFHSGGYATYNKSFVMGIDSYAVGKDTKATWTTRTTTKLGT